MQEKNQAFYKLLDTFGYTKESGGEDTFKGIYHNPEKKTKIVMSDSIAAVLSAETGSTLKSTPVRQEPEEMFSDLARLLYAGD